MGLGGLALTLVFEFSFGLWQGESWPVLLEAYSFKDGNIWPVVLAVTALAPYIATRLRGWGLAPVKVRRRIIFSDRKGDVIEQL